MTDGEALIALRDGDATQWRRVARVTLSFARGDHDLAQDALIKIMHRIGSMEAEASGQAIRWLWLLVYRLRIDRERAKRRRREIVFSAYEGEVFMPSQPAPEPRTNLPNALADVLDRLPEGARRNADMALQVHVLREPSRSLAEVHGISRDLVHKRAQRGRDHALLPAIGDCEELAPLREALLRSRRANFGKSRRCA